MARTAGNQTPPTDRHICRLVIRDSTGQYCLAALIIDRKDDLASLMRGIAKLNAKSVIPSCGLLFEPVVHLARLDQWSPKRFDGLYRRRNVKAFNRRAYAAVFVSQEPILDLPELLQDPRAFGITLERDVSRTEELVRRSRNPVKGRSSSRALLVTYRLRAWMMMVLLVTAISVSLIVIGLLSAAWRTSA